MAALKTKSSSSGESESPKSRKRRSFIQKTFNVVRKWRAPWRETSVHFSSSSFRMVVTKRNGGGGVRGHSNVQTAVRGVGKTQVCRPFGSASVLQGNDSPQDCLSKKNWVHIKRIVYELPFRSRRPLFINK